MRFVWAAVVAAVLLATAVGAWFGEYVFALASVAFAYARVWLLLALKKLGWPAVWKFLQPLLIRMAAWELPKRGVLWGVTLAIGVRNRRLLQARIDRLKRRARGLARAHYGRLESRFGRYTTVVLGGVLVIGSLVVSILVAGLYVFWYSATFFRALLMLGSWVLRFALSYLKIFAFNAIALSPFRWLPKLLPARQAALVRRYNMQIARQIIRRGRTTLPQLDRREFSFRQVLLMLWLPVRYAAAGLAGRLPRWRRGRAGAGPAAPREGARGELDTRGRTGALSARGSGTGSWGSERRERDG